MRVNSMTGFASSQGAASGYEWAWDIRSVNGKTLDIRARFPEWIEGLEPLVRKAISDAVARGNIAISLRVKKSDETAGLRVSQQGLQAAIDALLNVQKTASTAGLSLAPLTSFDLLNVRGVLELFSLREQFNRETARASARITAGFAHRIYQDATL
ncbi:YicC/YloC family endoribonuclease [Albirhodobacter sp. R86504]|uniref:YicC/YloC family endoribonuclease n=1 Tax=Albirhodobacter sp. R86504 TaxID=3093848 RepID=UPI00366BC981